MNAECALCGAVFATKSPRAKWCSEACRKRHDRAEARAQRFGQPPALVSGAVTAATVAELEAACQLDTPLGVTAVLLARRIDGSTLADSAASLIAMVRELARELELIRKERTVPHDPVDELRARRDAKLGRR